jgi:hypothetical protein
MKKILFMFFIFHSSCYATPGFFWEWIVDPLWNVSVSIFSFRVGLNRSSDLEQAEHKPAPLIQQQELSFEESCVAAKNLADFAKLLEQLVAKKDVNHNRFDIVASKLQMYMNELREERKKIWMVYHNCMEDFYNLGLCSADSDAGFKAGLKRLSLKVSEDALLSYERIKVSCKDKNISQWDPVARKFTSLFLHHKGLQGMMEEYVRVEHELEECSNLLKLCSSYIK